MFCFWSWILFKEMQWIPFSRKSIWANDVGNHQTDGSLNLATYISNGRALFALVNSCSLTISFCWYIMDVSLQDSPPCNRQSLRSCCRGNLYFPLGHGYVDTSNMTTSIPMMTFLFSRRFQTLAERFPEELVNGHPLTQIEGPSTYLGPPPGRLAYEYGTQPENLAFMTGTQEC